MTGGGGGSLTDLGPFAAPVDFATPWGAGDVVIGDFNGDGKPDILVLSEPSWKVLINTTAVAGSTPTFLAPVDVLTPAGSSHVVTGDFNRDGRLDLAVSIPTHNALAVLLNLTDAGSASLSFADGVELDAGQLVVNFSAGDFNGDGVVDLAEVNGPASIFINQTSAGASMPVFAVAAQASVTLDGGGCGGTAVGDLNGDGYDDLACSADGVHAYVDVTLSVPVDAGAAPMFAPPQEFTANAGGGIDEPSASGVAIADFNGDGRADLMFMDVGLELFVTTEDAGSRTLSFAAPDQVAYPNFARASLIVADFDHDSRLDVLWVGGAESVNDVGLYVLFNTTANVAALPTFEGRFTVALPSPVGVAAGDLNGDLKPDLVVGMGATLRVYLMR
jgi:hypothetical protein